jgi:hypothetical protein
VLYLQRCLLLAWNSQAGYGHVFSRVTSRNNQARGGANGGDLLALSIQPFVQHLKEWLNKDGYTLLGKWLDKKELTKEESRFVPLLEKLTYFCMRSPRKHTSIVAPKKLKAKCSPYKNHGPLQMKVKMIAEKAQKGELLTPEDIQALRLRYIGTGSGISRPESHKSFKMAWWAWRNRGGMNSPLKLSDYDTFNCFLPGDQLPDAFSLPTLEGMKSNPYYSDYYPRDPSIEFKPEVALCGLNKINVWKMRKNPKTGVTELMLPEHALQEKLGYYNSRQAREKRPLVLISISIGDDCATPALFEQCDHVYRNYKDYADIYMIHEGGVTEPYVQIGNFIGPAFDLTRPGAVGPVPVFGHAITMEEKAWEMAQGYMLFPAMRTPALIDDLDWSTLQRFGMQDGRSAIIYIIDIDGKLVAGGPAGFSSISPRPTRGVWLENELRYLLDNGGRVGTGKRKSYVSYGRNDSHFYNYGSKYDGEKIQGRSPMRGIKVVDIDLEKRIIKVFYEKKDYTFNITDDTVMVRASDFSPITLAEMKTANRDIQRVGSHKNEHGEMITDYVMYRDRALLTYNR